MPVIFCYMLIIEGVSLSAVSDDALGGAALTAKGDGNLAEVFEESEQVELAIADGAVSDGRTENYVEPQSGPMP